MSAETIDLAEALRLWSDPDFTRESIGLVAAMVANDARHPAQALIPTIPYALELAESPEKATATIMHLATLLVVAIGEAARVNGVTPTAYLQSWALLP